MTDRLQGSARVRCRHVLIPHAGVSGYIWTVCNHCGDRQMPEPQPSWFDFREQYDAQHAEWEQMTSD
jgi:hypothetical protein